jgi:hypothetical protein
MSHWEKSEINLGIIKAGSPKKIIFRSLESIPTITAIVPYCGCTATKYDEQTKELVITYSNTNIPEQVQGAQSVTKRIDIIYEDQITEILTIKATRIR